MGLGLLRFTREDFEISFVGVFDVERVRDLEIDAGQGGVLQKICGECLLLISRWMVRSEEAILMAIVTRKLFD